MKNVQIPNSNQYNNLIDLQLNALGPIKNHNENRVIVHVDTNNGNY